MRRLRFTKMVATGNDFVVVDFRHSLPQLARSLCQRKTGIGADGLLVLERSMRADFKMRIFNPDGSEPEMCGNGLRCAVLKVCTQSTPQRCALPEHTSGVKIETKAGIYEATITGKNRVKIKMEEPKGLKRDFPVTLNGREIRINYIDTGVPHIVIFVQGLDKMDVESIGRSLRYHRKFKPRGTNVDFVELIDDKNIRMRTYERGVEGETLACGTGAVASAIVTHNAQRTTHNEINVHARGGILKVYFKNTDGKIKDVYLEGEAREVYRGKMTL